MYTEISKKIVIKGGSHRNSNICKVRTWEILISVLNLVEFSRIIRVRESKWISISHHLKLMVRLWNSKTSLTIPNKFKLPSKEEFKWVICPSSTLQVQNYIRIIVSPSVSITVKNFNAFRDSKNVRKEALRIGINGFDKARRISTCVRLRGLIDGWVPITRGCAFG
jgi:hypothetical protein